MTKQDNSHVNRQLSPFNRGWYNPKKVHTQVNGHTDLSVDSIILQNDVVKRQKR
ncbi:YpzG family protein [Bacillus sp. FJAT-50079]|uniref:YpzG family protein n=1 Tax=Bacillus sp. FJAT-50079 TaxID=2833577 RepID=UPI001BC91F68|nr:YpzG family protein [Bacillus sp. FJAT-50079]MBS4209130.1 YpzG family protein [Bacillus sp. FJAT-50079]